jgi:uncharacterized protein (TIGR02246 family)
MKPSRSEDERAIRSQLDSLYRAWAAGDAVAYAAHFTPDADYVAFDGIRYQGTEENVAAHQPLFRSILRGSHLVGGIESLVFLSDDVALLYCVGSVVLRWQRKPHPGRRSIQTMVAVRQGNQWRFRAFHNGRIRSTGQLRQGIFRWLSRVQRRL